MSVANDPIERTRSPIGGKRHKDPAGELRQVLAALGAALGQAPSRRDLPGIFERELQRALSLRTIRLREIAPRLQARLVTPTRTPDSIVLGVPSGNPLAQAVLEAWGGPGRRLDDADHDLLSAAAELGGLVLEASRSRTVSVGAEPRRTPVLVGSTRAMQALRERIARVAATDFTALVEGESGTGKELVARQLHDLSRRCAGPFVAVNCAAVVETLLEAELFGIEERTATGVRGRRGKFELADGGTLFLDEVSDLSASAQAKLLRAMQDLSIERVGGAGSKRLNVRVVVATNRPLADLVERRQFRADLYYRLSGVNIRVPPLRERRDDIVELARHFLATHRAPGALTLSAAAEDALRAYDWPGNVRELERLVEGAVALGGLERIELEDLPPHVRGDYEAVLAPSIAAGDSLRAWGTRYVRLVLERCGHNKRRACRVLDISYHTLQAYLRAADRVTRMSTSQLPAWVTSMSDVDDIDGTEG
jgi:DNA-binding NtrC family response regulator